MKWRNGVGVFESGVVSLETSEAVTNLEILVFMFRSVGHRPRRRSQNLVKAVTYLKILVFTFRQ
jgi:hypothetical protein